jgi:hypothetical protein
MDASLDVVELVQRVHRNNCWTPLGPLFLKDGEVSIQKPPIFTPGEFLCQVYQPYGDAGLQRWGVIPRFFNPMDFPISMSEDHWIQLRILPAKHRFCIGNVEPNRQN